MTTTIQLSTDNAAGASPATTAAAFVLQSGAENGLIGRFSYPGGSTSPTGFSEGWVNKGVAYPLVPLTATSPSALGQRGWFYMGGGTRGGTHTPLPLLSIPSGDWTFKGVVWASTASPLLRLRVGFRAWKVNAQLTSSSLITLPGADAQGWVFDNDEIAIAAAGTAFSLTIPAVSVQTFTVSPRFFLYFEVSAWWTAGSLTSVTTELGDSAPFGAVTTFTLTTPTIVAGRAGVQASESDTALGGSYAQVIIGTQPDESDSPFSGTPALLLPGNLASESDLAMAGTAALNILGTQAVESDTPRTGVPSLVLPGSLATETDLAHSGATNTSGVTVLGDLADLSTLTNMDSDLYAFVDNGAIVQTVEGWIE